MKRIFAYFARIALVRAVTKRLTQAIALVSGWVRGLPWVPIVFTLATVSLVLWLTRPPIPNPFPPNKEWSVWLTTHVPNAETIFGLLVLAFLLWSVAKVRGTTVVEPFLDYRKDPVKGAAAGGLATALFVQLITLRDLYREVVGDQPLGEQQINGRSPALALSIAVDDADSVIKDAFSAESKLSFGPVSIPVGTLWALFGRLLQGPSISGTLQTDGSGCLVLTAQMTRQAKTYVWRVEGPSASLRAPASDGATLPGKMIEELAYKVFTTLVSGYVRWEATKAFTEGLRAFHNSLRTEEGRILNLEQAERKFLEALAVDEAFDLAYYNLGVVYTEYDKRHSTEKSWMADQAFSEALKHNPMRWQAAIALAQLQLNRALGKVHVYVSQPDAHDSIALLCDRVVESKPYAAAMAYAYAIRGTSALRVAKQPKVAISSLHWAVGFAWWTWCAATIREGGRRQSSGDQASQVALGVIPKHIDLTCYCLSELADACKDAMLLPLSARLRFARARLRESIALKPSSSSIVEVCLKLGQAYAEEQEYKDSIASYDMALQWAPESVTVWAWRACSYAAQETSQSGSFARGQEKVASVRDRILICAMEANGSLEREVNDAFERKINDALQRVKTAFNTLDQLCTGPQRGAESRRIEAIMLLLEGMRAALKLKAQDMAAIAWWTGNFEYIRDLYTCQRPSWAWERAQVAATLGHLYFTAALSNTDLYGYAARSYQSAIELLEKNYFDALRLQNLYAKRAEALYHVNQPLEALAAAQQALELNPLSSDVHTILSYAYEFVGDYQAALEEREAAVEWLTSAQWEQQAPRYLDVGWGYWKLAEHSSAREEKERLFKEATASLENAFQVAAQTNDEVKGDASYLLGRLYDRLGQYEKAVVAFRIARELKAQAPLLPAYNYARMLFAAHEYHDCIEAWQYLVRVSVHMYHKHKSTIAAAKRSEFTPMSPGIARIEDNAQASREVSLCEVLALAENGLANAYAERDPTSEFVPHERNLAYALRYAYQAIHRVETLKRENGGLTGSLWGDGDVYATLGWIYFKTGDVQRAQTYLEQALSFSDDPMTCLHLAMVCATRWRLCKDHRCKDILVRQIEELCQHIQELVVADAYAVAYSASISALLDQIHGSLAATSQSGEKE